MIKQWWSTILPISTKRTITSQLNSLNTEKEYDIWRWKRKSLGEEHKCGGLLKQGYVARLKSSLQNIYGRHHNLVYRYEISISQMTKDLFLLRRCFLSSIDCQDFDQTWLYIWVTRWVSYKKQELRTLREHLDSPLVLCGVCVAHIISCLWCPIMCLFVLRSVLWCSLSFPQKNNVRSSLPPVGCRRAHALFTLFVFFCA
jgi:hypothetical protein